jgi:hypothetical protein
MLTATTPYCEDLGSGLTLRSVADDTDAERVARFNGLIHGPLVADMTRQLIHHHPATRPEHWLFVEDEQSGAVVSSLALIPWRWRFEGVELRAGEMGIVGTLDAYRRRGLVRALDRRFKRLLADFDLSHIQGIPYFYRQFGYEYALPLEGGYHLALHEVPDNVILENVRFRRATPEDLRQLMALYDDAALPISSLRAAAAWEYILGPAQSTEMAADYWLALVDDAPAGYWRVSHYGFGEGLIISEVSLLAPDLVPAVLSQCKQLALAAGKPYIRLNLPRQHILMQMARTWNAQDMGTYAWQIHLPDVARLLRKLAPVFERRLAASPFTGFTGSFVIDLYREAFALNFETGRLRAVTTADCPGDGDLRLPPPAFTPLVLGYRSLDKLQEFYPDAGCRRESRVLADVLFPLVDAFIYTIY